MATVVGHVTKVVKGKGIVQLKMGTFERLNITVKDSSSGEEVKISRLVKPGNDGQNLVGKHVSVTYKEEVKTTADGEEFTVRSTDSKGFVLLDESGNPVQSKFGGGAAPSSSGSPSKPAGGYNSDGARHGMIVNNAVLLAHHRGVSDSLDGLMAAAADVVALTKFVESGATPSAAPAPAKKPPVSSIAKKVVDEDESPFDDE